MAVTRGSAKRSSCCPSTSNGGAGNSSTPAEGSNLSTITGGGTAEDVGNSHHHRGGGHRQSKRPALVDRTNNGLPTSAAGSNMMGQMTLCPNEAQASLSGPVDGGSGATTAQMAPCMNGLQTGHGKPIHGGQGVAAPLVSTHNARQAQHSGGVLTQAAFNSIGAPGGSAQSRAASKRNMAATRGRSKGRGSTSSSGPGTRRRRSDGGQGTSNKIGSDKLTLSSGGNCGFLPVMAAMDCDNQPKDLAERDAEESDNDDAQRLLLTDETLTSCSDGLGNDSGSAGASDFGLMGSTFPVAPTFGGSLNSKQGHAVRNGLEDDYVGMSGDGRRDSAVSSSGIQLLAVQEDLGQFTQPATMSSSIAAGRQVTSSAAYTSSTAQATLLHPWEAAAASRGPEATGMSLSQHSDSQETSWSTGAAPPPACLLSVPHPSLGGAALASAQDRLQGSAVQAPERDMASLLRDAESWQISSIRQNRVGGAPEEWTAQPSEHSGMPQGLRGDAQGTGAQSSIPGAPPLLPVQQHGGMGDGLRPFAQQGEQSQSLRLDAAGEAAGLPFQQNQKAPGQVGHPFQQHGHQGMSALQMMQGMAQPGEQHLYESQPGSSASVLSVPSGSQVLHGAQAGQGLPGVGIQNGVIQGSFSGSSGGLGAPLADSCAMGFSQHLDIDGSHTDPQLCAAYAVDIFQHLKSSELRRRPMEEYMEKVQSDINEQMRGILIDWLVEVAEEYKLVADTLYLTCSFIDRYLSTTMVTRGRLQLLGVSCMLIASKYEEIYAPQVDEFCYITDNTYRREEVIEMERAVLKELHFELSYPTTKSFLRRFVRAAQADLPVPNIQLELLGNYFAELTLVDYNSLKFLPSVVAASAVFLAKRTLWPDAHPWTPTLQHYSSYTPSQLEECTKNLHDLHTNRRGCTLPAIREKYRQAKFQHVASIPPCPTLPASLFENSPPSSA